jgi:hypothetical protein
MGGPVLVLTGNTTPEVEFSEGTLDSPTTCFDVEAGGTWNRLPGKSTAVETPLLDAPLNLYEGLGVDLLLSSAGFEVV